MSERTESRYHWLTTDCTMSFRIPADACCDADNAGIDTGAVPLTTLEWPLLCVHTGHRSWQKLLHAGRVVTPCVQTGGESLTPRLATSRMDDWLIACSSPQARASCTMHTFRSRSYLSHRTVSVVSCMQILAVTVRGSQTSPPYNHRHPHPPHRRKANDNGAQVSFSPSFSPSSPPLIASISPTTKQHPPHSRRAFVPTAQSFLLAFGRRQSVHPTARLVRWRPPHPTTLAE